LNRSEMADDAVAPTKWWEATASNSADKTRIRFARIKDYLGF
jgi:hypothetical protein